MKTNETIATIKKRRSVRSYTDEQVPKEILETLLDVAVEAPNGMNYKEWHFTAIQNREVLQELNALIKKAFAKSTDPKYKERGESDTYCCYYHAPALIIASNNPEHVWAGLDCACALQNIFLTATSLGLSSCWINQLGQTCDDSEVRAFLTRLGIPVSHKVYGCAAIGYASPDVVLKEKKRPENTVNLIF